ENSDWSRRVASAQWARGVMGNSPSSGGEYEGLSSLQPPHSPQRQDYPMLTRYSSPDPRTHATTGATTSPNSTSDPRQDLSCAPYTPPSTTTGGVATAAAAGVLLSGASASGGSGNGVSASSAAGTATAASAGEYPGYHGGSYYTSTTSAQGYLSPPVSLLYPHLYPQQGQLALLDPRTQNPTDQYSVGTAGANSSGLRDYTRHDGYRDMTNSTTGAHQSMMGAHMTDDSLHGAHAHDRYMSNGTRTGGPSPNDPSVWRPY
ncbi:unnamed protein product, partial [Meganyctiphanes norvegica]